MSSDSIKFDTWVQEPLGPNAKEIVELQHK